MSERPGDIIDSGEYVEPNTFECDREGVLFNGYLEQSKHIDYLEDKAKERLEYWDIARDVNAKLEAENRSLRNDLEYHVKNRSELTKQLAEVYLHNKKLQKALEIMGVSITKEI